MRWRSLIFFFVLLAVTLAEPDPKKYKNEVKEKTSSNKSLTDDEKKFLREVEAKFGIKSDVPLDNKEVNDEKEKDIKDDKPLTKPPFPAVIAIEIVNDTDTKTKGKRTIDANLGYGYRTNTGYSYSYFGKPSQDNGKFMIYPYSQQDIPATSPTTSKQSSNVVEIQPSRAYELVPVNQEEQTGYEYKKPQHEFETNEKVKSYESPQSQYTSNSPSTLYTTYNGEKFSGLQGQFPKVMSNYFVDSSQLLQNPQYQSAGLTQDYLRSHGSALEKRVVPVLVLRIPSSYLKNPSAELYANLPQNYPLSQYLNNVNLQELVNQYFKKIGYSVAPQITTHQHSNLERGHAHSAPVSNYEPQHYAAPHVRPSYTQADYSGVQYSAVQPVMAKYPSHNYVRQQYYTSQSQPIYRQPVQQPNYEYRYQYVAPSVAKAQQSYYTQPQYQRQPAELQEQQYRANLAALSHNSASQVQYEVQHDTAPAVAQDDASLSYARQNAQLAQHYAQQIQQTSQEYEAPKANYAAYQQVEDQQQQTYSSAAHAPEEAAPAKEEEVSSYAPAQPAPAHFTTHTQSYYRNQDSQARPIQQETITIYQNKPSLTAQKYIIHPGTGAAQTYIYQKQVNEDSASDSLVISENYPSKDHTQVTVLPYYKSPQKATDMQQSVSYVTPLPYSMSKYQSKYKVMSPQTILKNTEQVSYVNSHSLPMHYLSDESLNTGEVNPEEEYTISSQHVPPVGSQKPSPYPKNYHSHPKRMVNKDDSKQETAKAAKKEVPEKKDEKKSS